MRVDIDEPRLRARLLTVVEKAQAVLDQQVIADTDPFVPMDQGTLKDSVKSGSDIGKGQLKYDTPYAAAQYYGLPHKSAAKHVAATMRWFEASKAVNKAKWIRLAKKMGLVSW